MNEKEIKKEIILNHTEKIKEVLGLTKDKFFRLYSKEYPLRNKDGKRYIDLVYEISDLNDPKKEKQLVVVEVKYKKRKAQYGAIEQTLLYADSIKKQLYKKNDIIKVFMSDLFSVNDLELCKANNIIPIQYDNKFNFRKG